MANSAFDALIFDVDGVLLDVSHSFVQVIRQAIFDGFEKYCGGQNDCSGYGKEQERILKLNGGFNDDYDLAWALLCICASTGEKLLSRALPNAQKLSHALENFKGDVKEWVASNYGELIPYGEFRKHCDELYLGTEKKRGLQALETPLLHKNWRDLPLPVGLYTGRDLAELACAYKSLGWEAFPPENVIHRETGICKPSPLGLELLCKRFGAQNPLYFGDTASDLLAYKAFGKGSFVAIGELLDVPHRFANCDEALIWLENRYKL